MTFTVTLQQRILSSLISLVQFLCKLDFTLPPASHALCMQQQHWSPHQKGEVHGATG